MNKQVQITWVGYHRVEVTLGIPHSFHLDTEINAYVVWVYDVNKTRVVIPINSILKWMEIAGVTSRSNQQEGSQANQTPRQPLDASGG